MHHDDAKALTSLFLVACDLRQGKRAREAMARYLPRLGDANGTETTTPKKNLPNVAAGGNGDGRYAWARCVVSISGSES